MKKLNLVYASFAGLWATENALAHHAMGSKLPVTFIQGLLSGIGHPVIGIDHLAFVIGVGVVAAFSPRPVSLPLVFIATTLLGCFFVVVGGALPMAELIVSASVLLLGALILSGLRPAQGLWFSLFALAGFFHGYAYGQSIVGAETWPLVGYLFGFGTVQYLIASSAVAVIRLTNPLGRAKTMYPRLAGAVIAGVGVTVLVENLEAVLLV